MIEVLTPSRASQASGDCTGSFLDTHHSYGISLIAAPLNRERQRVGPCHLDADSVSLLNLPAIGLE
jgi:hypothetical protein